MLVWRRILVPTDFSETSEAAVRQGVDLARTFNASVILLYVGDGPASESATDFPLGIDADLQDAERERMLRILAPFDRQIVRPELVVSTGAAAQEIVRCAEEREVDLIVMGTHGRSGVRHMLLGSVAEKVIRTAPCPVLVVRGSAAAVGVEVQLVPASVGVALNA
ncbi:MAG: universal stress protein [Vicinamibacterales bacterium]